MEHSSTPPCLTSKYRYRGRVQVNRKLIFIGLAIGVPHHSIAQSYPSKSIRMIIPAAPGGGVDTIGRAVGQKVSEALGQPVVPDNRPGAGTMIASELTAKAAPDGYTFLMVTNSHAINASVQKNLKYDPVNDFSEALALKNAVGDRYSPGCKLRRLWVAGHSDEGAGPME